MATIAGTLGGESPREDHLSGTPRANAIDRWIYVFTAASFIAVTLAGFIPDSRMKLAAVEAGQRPPFPLVLHVHAVLMGSFLLLLLAQTWLMATGRKARHMQLGRVGMILVPLLVVVGFILAPTMYHQVWNGAQHAPPGIREKLQATLPIVENILLLQIRIGLLFPLFIWIGLSARLNNPGMHKRMMILATVMAIPASVDRIPWLPSSMPASAIAADLYTLAMISPMFLWDVFRNRRIHEAYWIWIGVNLPFAILLHSLWNTDWWHAAARTIMGVG
jgi:hypothetical protein